MAELSSFELGWLVGILEGEGNFTYNAYTQGVTLQMNDEDTVYKAASIFERLIGKPCEVIEFLAAKAEWGSGFRICLYGESARSVMRIVVTHMSFRRRQKIWQCLNCYKAPAATTKLDITQLSLMRKT